MRTLGEFTLCHSDNLSNYLQNPKLCAVDGLCTASDTVETLKSIRNDMRFDLFWEKVLTHAKRLDESTLHWQRSKSRSIQDYFGYGKGKEAVHTCSKDFYCKHYFEAFDTVIKWTKIVLIGRISKYTHCWNRSYWKRLNTTDTKKSWKK